MCRSPGRRKTLPVETTRHAFAYVFAGSGKFCNASGPLAVPTEAVGWADTAPPSEADNRSLVLFDRGDELTVQAGEEGIRFLLVSGKPLEDFGLLKNFDWYGLIFMAGFLGALEYVLEEGPRYDWFDDDTIFTLAILSAVSAVAFFARVLTARVPIVDLRAFANRNFAVGSLFSFVLGIGLYGLTYHLSGLSRPGARLRCADDRRDHVRLRPGDVFHRADRRPARERFDPRFILVAGFVFFAIGTWQMTYRDVGLGFLGIVVAAGIPRRRPDVRDHSGDQYRARHAAA